MDDGVWSVLWTGRGMGWDATNGIFMGWLTSLYCFMHVGRSVDKPTFADEWMDIQESSQVIPRLIINPSIKWSSTFRAFSYREPLRRWKGFGRLLRSLRIFYWTNRPTSLGRQRDGG